jgi:hypothetical protein
MQQRPGKEAPREERQKTIVVEERPLKIPNIVEKLEGPKTAESVQLVSTMLGIKHTLDRE